MPVFYRTRDVRITHRSLQVSVPVPTVYLISELGPVCAVIPARPRVLVRASCSGGSVVVAALVASQPNHASGWVLLVLLLGMLAVPLTRRRPGAAPGYTLVAIWHGDWVCLYSTTDPIEFGQVRRALQRAVEWNDDATG